MSRAACAVNSRASTCPCRDCEAGVSNHHASPSILCLLLTRLAALAHAARQSSTYITLTYNQYITLINDTLTMPSTSVSKQSRKSSSNHRSTLSLQRTEIKIHVYDLLPPGKISTILWTIGSSLLHSGVVINNREYAYGGHDQPGVSGVYWTRYERLVIELEPSS